jgi:hypothetical protein
MEKIIKNWGGHLYCIEVSDGITDTEGVRIYRCNKDGDRDESDAREVFVDPHEMVKGKEWEPSDVLLVHVYTNNQGDEGGAPCDNPEGEPVTLLVDACEIRLTNGGGTLYADEDVEVERKKS